VFQCIIPAAPLPLEAKTSAMHNAYMRCARRPHARHARARTTTDYATPRTPSLTLTTGAPSFCHGKHSKFVRPAPRYVTASNLFRYTMLLILKRARTSTKRCMLVFVKPGADISRGCALAVIAYTFLLTHLTLPFVDRFMTVLSPSN
jgi:hypothetical protein